MKQTQVMCCRMTLEERRWIEALAARRSLPTASFMREVLLSHTRAELGDFICKASNRTRDD